MTQQKREARFYNGLATIGCISMIIDVGLVGIMHFVPTEALPEGFPYIAILFVFLPFFVAIFWVQGCTLADMTEWDRERSNRR
jgi:hypothetical protein